MNYSKGIAILNQIACDELLPKQTKKVCNISHVKRIKTLSKKNGISLREAYYIYQRSKNENTNRKRNGRSNKNNEGE